MDFLIPDFVNRDEQLATVWKMIKRELPPQLLLIQGDNGMGKTYLLQECREQCRDRQIAAICIDLDYKPDPDYMFVVQGMLRQLGTDAFSHLIDTIHETESLSAWKTVQKMSMDRALHELLTRLPAQSPSNPEMVFQDRVDIHGDIVGGNKTMFNIWLANDDPKVRQEVQVRITAALRHCLIKLTSERALVLFLDSWSRATTSLREWLCNGLLQWVHDGELSTTVAVVAGIDLPDLTHLLRRVGPITLHDLSEDAIRLYCEKRGLQDQEIVKVMSLGIRKPFWLAMTVDALL